MKKIISLILTVAMLFSMTTLVAPVSAETEVNDLFMADASREAFLNSKRSQPVELYLFQDIFATYAERSSADWYSWASGDISNFWPYKGIGSGIEPKYPLTRNDKNADFAMMIDLGEGASTYTDGMDLKSNPLVSYDTESNRYFVNADGVSYKLGEITEGKKGGNFATFGVKYDVQTNKIPDGLGIKEQTLNADVYPNIGTDKQITKAIYPVNRTGVTELNFLMTTTQVAAATKSRVCRVPATIKYADGSEEKIALLVGTVGADLQDAIVAVPKQYTTYAEIQANKVVAKSVTGKDVTNENVTIASNGVKNYLSEKSFVLATFMRGEKGKEFAGYVHSFSIPVDPTKTINSVMFEKDHYAIIGHYSENVPSKTTGTDMSTYAAVTIEGAPTDTHNYYIYVTRSCGSSGIFAMSTSYETYQSKIDKIEARIQALDETYNSAQKTEIAEIKNAIQSLEGEGVLGSDYDAELIAKLDTLYQSAEAEIKAAQIASVEGKITNMAFKYASLMREEVEGIKAEYDALIASGISASEFNSDLMSKFSKVYDVYVMSSGLEDKAESWGTEYLYTMYTDVIKAKELADGLVENPNAGDNVVAKETVEVINKFEKLAKDGLAIDTAIDGLDIVYNKAQLDAIVEIKKSIDEFKTADGTDKGLANAEPFYALYEKAQADLLQKDIDNTVAKINALGEFYSSAMDTTIAEIDKAIASIEERGRVIPESASESLKALKAQRDEAPVYEMFKLPYNKDVFESLEKYVDQYRNEEGELVKDSKTGYFVVQSKNFWTFTAIVNNNSSASEKDFETKFNIDSVTYKGTNQGIPYQFGKIRTTVNGAIDTENNSVASSVSNNITVDVPNNTYSKIHTVIGGFTFDAGVTITYKYADGSTSAEANITKIAGTEKSNPSALLNELPDYYKNLASIETAREYNKSSDKSRPTGGYSFRVVDHILTPNDKKILDKIEFTFSTTDAHIFAMTGQLAHSALLNKVLTEAVEGIDTTAEENVRSVLEGCSNIMAALDAKEAPYNKEFKTVVEENKNIFIAVESITSYTDLDSLTYTIKFTGPVAESSLTKALFAIKEIVKNDEGKDVNVAFNDYEIIPVVENGEIREVKLIIKNNFEYDRRFTLTVDKTVAGVSGKTIFTETVAEYDAKPAVDTDFKFEENGTGSVKIVNNMNDAQEVTAIIAVYNEKNQMVAKYLVNRVLATGESVAQTVAFQLSEGQKVECLVLDSLTNCKKVYNTFIVE